MLFPAKSRTVRYICILEIDHGGCVNRHLMLFLGIDEQCILTICSSKIMTIRSIAQANVHVLSRQSVSNTPGLSTQEQCCTSEGVSQ